MVTIPPTIVITQADWDSAFVESRNQLEHSGDWASCCPITKALERQMPDIYARTTRQYVTVSDRTFPTKLDSRTEKLSSQARAFVFCFDGCLVRDVPQILGLSFPLEVSLYDSESAPAPTDTKGHDNA